MTESQRDDHPDIQELFKWAKGAQQLGIGDTGLEIDRPFIPDPEIEAYFKDIRSIQKLLAALFPNGNPLVNPELIRSKYAKVFLILLLTGSGHFITSFVREHSLCDQYLPFRSRPDRFPQSTANTDLFASFCSRQWEFCARVFQYGLDLQFHEHDLILPIISKEKLGGGGSAIVYKIRLHPAYDGLSHAGPSREDSADPDTHTFVLKTYNTPDAERYYKNEVSGFSNLGGPHANIIGFHGSFVRDGTYNVLLEYADRGTLEQYFNTVQPPSSGEDILKFWCELFKTLRALAAIHSVQPSDSAASSDSSIFQGWHQDIKPCNILVKSKKGSSPYDVKFKLADLGVSHFKRHVPSKGEATDRDTWGTRAYGAPECYRADSDFEKIRFLVKQSVDIWSLGCTISEAAVWVIRGRSGLSEYRRRRGMETARIPDFRDGDCFHDGQQVLATVTEIHSNLLVDGIRACDHVTGATVAMVRKEMLIESDSRSSVRPLIHRTNGILAGAETKLTRPASLAGTGSVSGSFALSPPRTPPEPPPGHHQPRSGRSHRESFPTHTYTGSPASTSLGDEAHHRESAEYFFGPGTSPQVYSSNRPTQRQRIGPVVENEYSGNQLNRAFSEDGLAQDGLPTPSWREPQGTHQTRRRVPDDSFSGIITRNGPNIYNQDRQETYNASQRNSFTAPPGVSRTSTATLVQDLPNGLRPSHHHVTFASGARPPELGATGSSHAPVPTDFQTRRRPPFLSVTDAQQWKKDKKNHRPVRLTDDHLLADLNDRDQVFLIDNSSSMRSHRKEMCDLFGLLGYIVKDTDPDGIEIRYTMSRDRTERARNTGPLLQSLETIPYLGTSNIKIELGEIFQDYHAKLRESKRTKWLLGKLRSPRPVRRQNVYILTDGIWQPNCDPSQMIKKLVGSLEQNSMEREQFGIQFIRFGNDPDGISRLNQLDSGLGLSMDIVDTEPSNGNVWKMLLGAVNNWFDDDDVNTNGRAVSSPIVDTSPGANTSRRFERRSTHT